MTLDQMAVWLHTELEDMAHGIEYVAEYNRDVDIKHGTQIEGNFNLHDLALRIAESFKIQLDDLL